jgi:hypothetical protein
VRAVEVRHPLERLEENLAGFQERTLPAIREFPGVTTVALLANRSTGLTVLNVTYRSQEEFEASRDRAGMLRAESLPQMGAQLERLTEMQVAIVGLRAPVGMLMQPDLPAQGRAAESRASADS